MIIRICGERRKRFFYYSLNLKPNHGIVWEEMQLKCTNHYEQNLYQLRNKNKLFSEGFWIYIDYQIELMIFQNWFEGFGESLKRRSRDGFALGGVEKNKKQQQQANNRVWFVLLFFYVRLE